jgi:hypothetical protein
VETELQAFLSLGAQEVYWSRDASGLYLQVQVSDLGREAGYSEFPRAFPRFSEANAGIVPQIRRQSLPSTSFTIHYLILSSFDAI